jgi:hypothetical protein
VLLCSVCIFLCVAVGTALLCVCTCGRLGWCISDRHQAGDASRVQTPLKYPDLGVYIHAAELAVHTCQYVEEAMLSHNTTHGSSMS